MQDLRVNIKHIATNTDVNLIAIAINIGTFNVHELF